MCGIAAFRTAICRARRSVIVMTESWQVCASSNPTLRNFTRAVATPLWCGPQHLGSINKLAGGPQNFRALTASWFCMDPPNLSGKVQGSKQAALKQVSRRYGTKSKLKAPRVQYLCIHSDSGSCLPIHTRCALCPVICIP